MLVAGESLRYTARDMDIIRREARVAAEGTREEMEQMEIACKGYEDLIEKVEDIHKKQLLKKVWEN